MLLVKDVDYSGESKRSSTRRSSPTPPRRPNLQIIASLDIARRQMELEGYEMVMRAIEIALMIRREVNGHPLISKYFRMLGRGRDDPRRVSGSRL